MIDSCENSQKKNMLNTIDHIWTKLCKWMHRFGFMRLTVGLPSKHREKCCVTVSYCVSWKMICGYLGLPLCPTWWMTVMPHYSLPFHSNVAFCYFSTSTYSDPAQEAAWPYCKACQVQPKTINPNAHSMSTAWLIRHYISWVNSHWIILLEGSFHSSKCIDGKVKGMKYTTVMWMRMLWWQ